MARQGRNVTAIPPVRHPPSHSRYSRRLRIPEYRVALPSDPVREGKDIRMADYKDRAGLVENVWPSSGVIVMAMADGGCPQRCRVFARDSGVSAGVHARPVSNSTLPASVSIKQANPCWPTTPKGRSTTFSHRIVSFVCISRFRKSGCWPLTYWAILLSRFWM